jgi:hypothetical protein
LRQQPERDHSQLGSSLKQLFACDFHVDNRG